MVICRRTGTSATSRVGSEPSAAPRRIPRDGAGPVFLSRRRPSPRTLVLLREAQVAPPVALRLAPLAAT